MKRSKKATLVIMASVSVLTGCERVPIDTFVTMSDCEHRFQPSVCEDAFARAKSLHRTSSPIYDDARDCDDDYGYGQCYSIGGGYVPNMSGVVVSDSPGYHPFPVYQYAGSSTMHNASGSAHFVPNQHAYTRVSKLQPERGSRITKRGGFGSIGVSKSKFSFGG